MVAGLVLALLVLAAVRLLGLGLREGTYPVHSRVGWQVWSTERLLDLSRTILFPLYANLVKHPFLNDERAPLSAALGGISGASGGMWLSGRGRKDLPPMQLLGTGTGDPGDLGGIVGFAAQAIDALGELGVGLFVLAETIFPPIPSEVILPLAGYLTQQGTMSFPLVIITSTLGAYVGAVLLYLLGSKLGLERSIRWLSKLPLVDREDFEKAAGWFHRHGRPAVFFGRLLPGIRSLISLPAGAERMNFLTFSAFTIAGSGLWNSLLITLGSLLGRNYEVVERYSGVLNYAVYAAIAGIIVFLVIRRVRRGRPAQG